MLNCKREIHLANEMAKMVRPIVKQDQKLCKKLFTITYIYLKQGLGKQIEQVFEDGTTIATEVLPL